MANRLVAAFHLFGLIEPLRRLSTELHWPPPGDDWKSLARSVRELDKHVAWHSGKVIALAREIDQLGCKGLRVSVSSDEPASLSRVALRLSPSELRDDPATKKALRRLVEILRLLASSGWWDADGTSLAGAELWSLRPVVKDVVAVARARGIEVAPIAFATRSGPRPSAARSMGEPKKKRLATARSSSAGDVERPTARADRGARVSVSQTSTVRVSTADSTTTRTTTRQTTTRAQTSGNTTTDRAKVTGKTTPAANSGSTRATRGHATKTTTPGASTRTTADKTDKARTTTADREPHRTATGKASADRTASRQAPPASKAESAKKGPSTSHGASKKRSKAGSFGGLPDDEVGGPAAGGGQAGLSEEASLFLSYGQLTWPCTEGELRAVHRQVVKTLHPDRHPGDAAASHRFMWLQRGYESLRARLASADAPARTV